MTPDPDHVTISLPADTTFVALARAAAASIAVELDFTIDDIEDLRIAVDELVTILIDADPSDHRIELSLTIDDEDSFAVRGSVADRRNDDPVDELTAQILTAVTADLRVEPTTCSFRARRSTE